MPTGVVNFHDKPCKETVTLARYQLLCAQKEWRSVTERGSAKHLYSKSQEDRLEARRAGRDKRLLVVMGKAGQGAHVLPCLQHCVESENA